MSLANIAYEEILLEQIANQGIQKAKEHTKIYRIVQGKLDEVEQEVQQLLAEGWICQGGIALYQDWFGQAMILDLYKDKGVQ